MRTKKLLEALRVINKWRNTRGSRISERLVYIEPSRGLENGELVVGTTLSIVSAIGKCEVWLPEELSIRAYVDSASLISAIRHSSECDLSMSGDKLNVITDRGTVRIVDNDIHFPPIVISNDAGWATIDTNVLRRCSQRLSCVRDSKETRCSRSQRLTAAEGTFRITSWTSKAWGCSWAECEGDAVDAMVPLASIAAAAASVRGPTTTIYQQPEGLGMVSDNVAVLLPIERSGAPPRSYEAAESLWSECDRWEVDREALVWFLTQAKSLQSRTSPGVWLIPTEDGLLCRYDREDDGDGCDTLLQCQCEGQPMQLALKLFSEAVDGSTGDGFYLMPTSGGLFVHSDGYAVGMGVL